ncbi:MAG: GtrA family protein [Bacteroidota bacterium]|nr:GtrA family protein [Bacteroidota bacterium]
MKKIIKKYVSDKFLRFVIVGSINTILNYGIFFACLKFLLIDYRIAGVFGFLSGAVSGFLLNRKWTFKSNVRLSSGSLKYFLVQLFCLCIHTCTIIVATEIFKVPQVFSQLVGICITTFINYELIRKFVFPENVDTENCCLNSEL